MAGGDTFDLGLAGDGPADATIKGPAQDPQTHSSLPHLTIGEVAPIAPTDTADLKVVTRLGEGGMGVVWLARQESLDRDVAIKRVRPEQPHTADDTLLREARFMGGLEHPNIVPVHALGLDDDGRLALVMKRVEGVAWRRLIREPDHPWWTAELERGEDRLVRHVEILVEVCRAVHFAHSRGVVHRDLKPENVMIGAFGEVYVMDWGVAARLADEPVTRTLVGTPAYMAPELAIPGRPLSPATDVYLLGGCLYELLAGRAPHRGETVQEVLVRARDAGVLEVPSGAPPELAAIAVRACAPDAADRWPDALALQKALSGWMRQRHALALVAAARARLEALRPALGAPEPDPAERARIESRFVECRFGFAQALEAFPGLDAARDGLADALAAMVPFEIEHGNLDQAGAYVEALEELGRREPDLRDRLAAARRAREEQHALARELDVDVALGERTIWLGILAVISLGITGAIVAMDRAGSAWGHREAVLVMLVLFAIFPFGFLVARRTLTANRMNRSLTALLVGCGVAVLANRLVSWRFDGPLPAMLATDALFLTFLAFAAAVLDRRYVPVVGIYAAAAALVVAFPSQAVVLFGVVVVIALVVASAILARSGRGR